MRTLKEKLKRKVFLIVLVQMRTYFEQQITGEFNPELSARLDAVQFLLDSFNGSVQLNLSAEMQPEETKRNRGNGS